MNFRVRVLPRASRTEIRNENGILKVRLTKPACGGLANSQLTEILAKHFKVKKYQVKILKGFASRNKLVEIDDGD